MNPRTSSLLAVAALLMLPIGHARAQEIDATVTVNSSQLSPSAQQEVAGFADDMQSYLNNTRWTGATWDGPKIKMTIGVVFSGSNGTSYSARMVIGSQRSINNSEKLSPMVRILDDSWSFDYVRSQPFVQDPTRYDPFTGLVDFYAYVAIGLDLDSYAPLGGAAIYDKAWTLAQRAQVLRGVDGWSTDVPSGNYSRYELIRELTDLRFAPLRTFIYNYHFNGLDIVAADHDRGLDSVSAHLSELVIAKDKLVQPTVLLRVLNDAKYMEYAELFTGSTDALLWRKLAYIDPGHESTYEAARNH